MERGETDVLHFLFAKKEALIGRGVRLRDYILKILADFEDGDTRLVKKGDP